MAAKQSRKAKTRKTVETLRHGEASRKNIPTAEHQSVMNAEEQTPIRVAYERRDRDLAPQLVWRGKDCQDWSDLVVHAPPLYIQEKVHPKVLIDDLMHRTREQERAEEEEKQPTLFADLYADFIVLVDDGHGDDDLLHLVVEVKGYRREDAKDKKSTMDTYWVPGVNHLGTYGRWAFAEFTDVYEMQDDFAAKVEGEFHKMIDWVAPDTVKGRQA
jgi:hypothetical protein